MILKIDAKRFNLFFSRILNFVGDGDLVAVGLGTLSPSRCITTFSMHVGMTFALGYLRLSVNEIVVKGLFSSN